MLPSGRLVRQEAGVSESCGPSVMPGRSAVIIMHGVTKTGSAGESISSCPSRILLSSSSTSYGPTALCNTLDAGKLMAWV